MKFDKRFKISLKKIYSEPIYNEKYLKDKIKSCNAKTGTNFRNNKIAKEGSQFIGLLVILIDSVFRTEIYYLQVFLQERKYVVKEEKKFLLILIEKFLMKKILMKKILKKKFLMKKSFMKKIKKILL